MTVAIKGGRPLKFETEEELQEKIADYFLNTPKDEWTITGLAIALGTFRSLLCDYEEREEFYYTVKNAKQMVENSYEIDLKKYGRSGTIFALKNFGWQDKQEVETSGTVTQIIVANEKDKEALEDDYSK